MGLVVGPRAARLSGEAGRGGAGAHVSPHHVGRRGVGCLEGLFVSGGWGGAGRCPVSCDAVPTAGSEGEVWCKLLTVECFGEVCGLRDATMVPPGPIGVDVDRCSFHDEEFLVKQVKMNVTFFYKMYVSCM